MKILENAIEAAKDYDTLFVDVYGVLFNGVSLFDRIPETLQELHKQGKKIVILSNTTQLSSDAISGYSERGMVQGVHYDYFMTSGEFLRHILLNDKQFIEKQIGHELNTYKCLFMSNSNIFDGTSVTKAEQYSDADVIYLAPVRASYGGIRVDCLRDADGNDVSIDTFIYEDWTKLYDDKGQQGLAEIHFCLEKLASMNKPILLANPDIFANSSIDGKRYPLLTQGGVGAYYEQRFGGKVIRIGKPYPEIFEFAKTSTNSSGKILMFGDTLWTDVLGAQLSGIDSALVRTGITEIFTKGMAQATDDEKIEHLINTGNQISGMKNAAPTFLLDQFARGA